METLEALAKGLSEAQMRSIVTGSPIYLADDMASRTWASLKRLGVCDPDTSRLTRLGRTLRAHLLAQKDHTPS